MAQETHAAAALFVRQSQFVQHFEAVKAEDSRSGARSRNKVTVTWDSSFQLKDQLAKELKDQLRREFFIFELSYLEHTKWHKI